MCGIAGWLRLESTQMTSEMQVRRMLGAIRHRGPDQFGIYLDESVALGSARLSIIDLDSGQQPISNEDQTLWIVFNGEIFNYVELRRELQTRGHRFSTATDTEVLLHLYEEHGPGCLARLNGQFAVAIWDSRSATLFLARDRFGVRPLYYTVARGALVFGSEIKAILADPHITAQFDPVALDQIFTFWSALAPRTAFRGVQEIPPGHYLLARNGQIAVKRYWQLEFHPDTAGSQRSTGSYLDEFRELLRDATRIRLRADVPVGAYLSGGLDSSTIAALIRKEAPANLDTFSIAFADPDFDESEFQRRMARFLGTHHQVVHVTHAEIGHAFPDAIWHAETPVLRTSPVPMFLLSERVHEQGYKVVLTGEGADELLAGYDIFKEAAVRRFWARQPNSTTRPALLQRLYADIPRLAGVSTEFLAAFFRAGLTEVGSPFYSHAIRWRNTRRTHRFFSPELLHAVGEEERDSFGSLQLPGNFAQWHPLEQAQYLESSIFLSEYLLSSQGDRMAMAHSVEGRFPFLDHRVVEFSTRLPARLKLNGLNEKYLLKQLGRELLPDDISCRPKRPYRAPIHRAFFNGAKPDYLPEVLSPARIEAAGVFHRPAVMALVDKLEREASAGETDDMALAGIISTQLIYERFIRCYEAPQPIREDENLKIYDRRGVLSSL